MARNLSVLLIAAIVIALPFLFRVDDAQSTWHPGDPELVIITSHNEAIRYEFAEGFSAWHAERYGTPVKVDWRAIGGTSEIMRYLEAESVAAFRSHWRAQGQPWNLDLGRIVVDRRFNPDRPPDEAVERPDVQARWDIQREAYLAFRETDDADAFSCKIDLFFGGGEYDHSKAYRQGLTVVPWPEGEEPPGTVFSDRGEVLIPDLVSGETWRTPAVFGSALSTFGICYNMDRLADLGVEQSPRRWVDLTHPAYFRQVGIADPTKSGSVSKAFEMIIHQQCHERIRGEGFTDGDIDRFEAAIAQAGLAPGELPAGVPPAYQAALELGWLGGIRLVQAMGANARYFTDSSSKVPIDVSTGDAAAGLAIDFYGRFQAENSRSPDGEERMQYVTPAGGSSVSADPISLLRGAPHRELAVRFMTFVLGEEGQKLWNYSVGSPGGPRKFALRRLPIRRDFYPSETVGTTDRFAEHQPHMVDDVGDPTVNPYRLADEFVYRRRWTSAHFSIQRDLIRAMCLDAGEELRGAWQIILRNGGPDAHPEAMALLQQLPEWPQPLTWRSVLEVSTQHDRLDYMREWTSAFRANYDKAKAMAIEAGGPAS